MPSRPGAAASPEAGRGARSAAGHAAGHPAGPDVDRLDAALPQTQCGRCGFPGCRPYAEALVRGETEANRCPPGGEATIAALGKLLGRPVPPLDPALGPVPPRRVARIRIADCIGCTKCIRACPVDAIIGAPKHRHHVLESRCTGCDLCLPPCPTDCITMIPIDAAWTATEAARARRHHGAVLARRLAAAHPPPATGAGDPLAVLARPDEKARRLAAIRARVRGAGAGGGPPA